MAGKRGNKVAAKRLRLEKERQRRIADAPPGLFPSEEGGRPDFSKVPWGELTPSDARKIKRTMLITCIVDQAVQANEFLEWGLKPRPVEDGSRLALDDESVTLEGAPNLISSTARWPAMNATENLVAAAQVVAEAFTKGQARTSAVSVLCRTAMESAAKSIWLINEADPAERRRRCFGFIESERGWQDHFDGIEAQTLKARTDELVAAEAVEFEKHRDRFKKRLAQITDLPTDARRIPPGHMKVVKKAAEWVDLNKPRLPNPELDRVMMPRGAESFYSLGSGFVHGFKWARDYVTNDIDLLEMTVDAFGAALRMTECAVSLFEAQSVGPHPDPHRTRNYPSGLAEIITEWAPRYA